MIHGECVANRYRASAARLDFLSAKFTAGNWFDAESLKKLMRYHSDVRVFRNRARSDRCIVILVVRHSVECRALVVPVAKIWRGDRAVAPVLFP